MAGQMPILLYKHMPIHLKNFFSTCKLKFTPADEFEDFSDRIVRDNIRTYAINKKNTSFIDDFTINTPASSNWGDIFKFITSQLLCEFAKDGIIKATQKANFLQKDTPEIIEGINAVKNQLHSMLLLQMIEDKFNKNVWECDLQAPFNPAHTGFMLGLDTRNSFFHDEETGCDVQLPILPAILSQNEDLPYFSDFFTADDKESLLISFLRSKNREFGNIPEWRVIRFPNTANLPTIADIDVPPQMVREVYLGARADEFLEAEAAEFCKKNNAKLFRMVLDGDDLIEPTPIHLS